MDKYKGLTLDEAAERAGGYVKKPTFPTILEYDIRGLTDYCIEHGLDLENPPKKVMEQFSYKEEPLVYA